MKLCTGCLLLFMLLASSCGSEIEPGRSEAEPITVTGLVVTEAQPVSVGAFRTVAGTIVSSDRSVLAARIDGRIARIRVKEGDAVDSGQALIDIADNPGLARLREADNAVVQARQGLAGAEAALTLARQTEQRYRQLYANQAATPQEMDRAVSDRDRALSALRQAGAHVERAVAARDAARTMAAYNTLRAPYRARVAKRLVDEGATVLPGMPLLTLDRLGTWQVRADVPEAFAGRLLPGDSVEVEVPAMQLRFPARLVEVQPAADPTSRSFAIKAESTGKLSLTAGLYARIYLPLNDDTPLLVPISAIAERGQLSGVFVVEDRILHWRLVRTGRRFDTRIEILAGLRSGDRIVSGGLARARDGARLETQP